MTVQPAFRALFALALVAVSCSPIPRDRTQPTRPNVLLIVADDMGFSDIGSFGGEIATEALDALAREGLQLSGFHVLPTCSPSRSVLLTGTDNHVAGLGTMAEFKPPEAEGVPGYAGYLNFEVAALPEVLKANGYRTYMAGKWHLGEDERTVPHARGFDESFVLLQGGASHWADRRPVTPSAPVVYQRNGRRLDALPAGFYSTEYYTDSLLEWMRRDQADRRPFFAYLAFTAPHDPLHAPQDYIDKYKGVYDAGWDVLREQRLARLKELGIVDRDARSFPRLPTVSAWNDLSEQERTEAARDMEVYAAMVDFMDDQIGRVLDQLRETGAYDDTLILFFSDNGANGAPLTAYPGQTEEHLNSFDNTLQNRGLPNSIIEMGPGWAQASMAPSRLFKAFPAEGGIRSPLLIKLPGDMAVAGTMNPSFVHIRDLMPTILDVAGVEPPDGTFEGRPVARMQGSSVKNLLEGKVAAPGPEVGRVGYELFGMKAFFMDGWKILRLPRPYGTGEWELFDLARDPGELNDLSRQHPKRLEEMVAAWEQYKTSNGVLDIQLDVRKALEH